MKVYFKKIVGNSFLATLFAWILLALIFIGSIGYTASILRNFTFTFENTLSIIGCIIFSLAFLYLVFLPKKYKVRLVSKNIEIYDNNIITNMVFCVVDNSLKGKFKKVMECHTIGDNTLEIGKIYIATINKFNGLINTVEDIDKQL